MNVDHSHAGSNQNGGGGGGGFMGSSTPLLVGAAVGGAMGFMMPLAGTVMGVAGGAFMANKVLPPPLAISLAVSRHPRP